MKFLKSSDPEPNVKGQLNRNQFFASLAAGMIAGAGTVLLHLQNSAPQWAGSYAPIAAAVVSSLLLGLKFLNSGGEADGSEN